MKHIARIQTLVLLSTLILISVIAATAQADPQKRRVLNEGKVLAKTAALDLPGPPGKRFDYLAIWPEKNLLFVSHLGAGLLHVVDMKSLRVQTTIEGVPGIEAVALVPELGKAYTSNWGEHKVGVVSLGEMKVVKRIPVDDKPDGIAYAAPFRKIYVSDERAKTEFVIDVQKDEVVKKIRFDSETGVPQYDPVGKRVWVNLQEDNHIAEIDPATDSVIAKYPVGSCQGNHGMALDEEHRRAFLACEGNNQLAVFNLETRKPITTLELPPGADVVQFDPGFGRIYVACGSGAISVIQQINPDKYRKLADVPVERHVHSIAVDAATHKVYAPEIEEGGKPTSRLVIFSGIQDSSNGGRK